MQGERDDLQQKSDTNDSVSQQKEVVSKISSVLNSLRVQTEQLNAVAKGAIEQFKHDSSPKKKSRTNEPEKQSRIKEAADALNALSNLTNAQTNLLSELRKFSSEMGISNITTSQSVTEVDVVTKIGNGDALRTENSNGDSLSLEHSNGDSLPLEHSNGDSLPLEHSNGDSLPLEHSNGDSLPLEHRNGGSLPTKHSNESPVDCPLIKIGERHSETTSRVLDIEAEEEGMFRYRAGELPPPPGHDYDAVLPHASSESTPTVRKRRQSITPFAEVEKPRSEQHMIHHGGGQFVFSVGQYNLLADYVGSNYNYWFLYGADLRGPEGEARRKQLKERFYTLDQRGHRGVWPDYAQGILTAEEMRRVEEIEAESFVWENRVGRLSANIASLDVDILSLVELDHYEDHFKGNLSELGYDSVFVKRPRKASKDGCGVFWKRETFYYVAHSSLAFVDEVDSETNRKQTDRCCLCVLLRTRFRSLPILFVSVHLARNPENPRQDALRGKQLIQLLQLITSFTQKHRVADAPVIVCGDINATSISKIRGIAGAAAITAQQRIHPFLWRATDVPSLPTSVTAVRAMRVDTILFLNTHLQLVDVGALPVLSMEKPIPNEEHPSDHLPIKASFRVKSELKRCKDVAREWWAVASGENDSFAESPLCEEELRRAYMLYDYDGSNQVDKFSLSRGIGLLQLFASQETIEKVLSFGDNGTLQFEEFCVIYLSHERFSLDAMDQVFDWLDKNNEGFLCTEELYEFGRYFKGTALEMTPDHIRSAINLSKAMASQEDIERGEGISRDQFIRLLMTLYARLYFSPKVARLFKSTMIGLSLQAPAKSPTFAQFPALARVPSLKTLIGSPRGLHRQPTRIYTKNQRIRLESVSRCTDSENLVQEVQVRTSTSETVESQGGKDKYSTLHVETACEEQQQLQVIMSSSPSKRRRRGSLA